MHKYLTETFPFNQVIAMACGPNYVYQASPFGLRDHFTQATATYPECDVIYDVRVRQVNSYIAVETLFTYAI